MLPLLLIIYEFVFFWETHSMWGCGQSSFLWSHFQNGKGRSGAGPHEQPEETDKSAGLSLRVLHILCAGTFHLWHFQEGPMRGLSRLPPLCSHTLPAREGSLVVSPQTPSAEGALKTEKTGVRKEVNSSFRRGIKEKRKTSRKERTYWAQECLLFCFQETPDSDASLCKLNCVRQTERTGSAQSCGSIPNPHPGLWFLSHNWYCCCCSQHASSWLQQRPRWPQSSARLCICGHLSIHRSHWWWC